MNTKLGDELRELSDSAEKKRVEGWGTFHTTVRPEVIAKIEEEAKDSTAIYWRSFIFSIDLSEAEVAHLDKMGIKVGTNGKHTIISW